jgi:nitrite reductase/ring-hydroxylating ferredoxin subunit
MPPRFPFPLPNGWFRVAFADELAAREVRPLRYFGKDLVLAVFEDGTPQVFDAHCPHLGAHLGHGGRIEDDALRCPFHGWRFRQDGSCAGIEYATRTPKNARLRSWPTQVRNGLVWVWHHVEAKAPSWDVPEVGVVGDPDWSPLLHERFSVRTHNQEIAENTADPAHFAVVHGFSQPAELVITFDGARYRSTSSFDAPRRDGSTIPSTLDVAWYGLGLGVTRSTGSLEIAFLGTGTPVDVDEIDYCFSFTVCQARGFALDRGPGRAAIDEAMRQVRQDIPIWENKRYMARPQLCDGDGPIPRFREWAQQFYSQPDSAVASPLASPVASG